MTLPTSENAPLLSVRLAHCCEFTRSCSSGSPLGIQSRFLLIIFSFIIITFHQGQVGPQLGNRKDVYPPTLQASSWVLQWPVLTPWSSGRPSLVTSITRPSASSTSSSAQDKPSGCGMVPTSSQNEALARYSVPREVPCSALKGETVPDSLPATPKSPPTRRVPPRGKSE